MDLISIDLRHVMNAEERLTWKLVPAVALLPKVVSAAGAAELVVVPVAVVKELDATDVEVLAVEAKGIDGAVDTVPIEDKIDEVVDKAGLVHRQRKEQYDHPKTLTHPHEKTSNPP